VSALPLTVFAGILLPILALIGLEFVAISDPVVTHVFASVLALVFALSSGADLLGIPCVVRTATRSVVVHPPWTAESVAA
jgi:hypothetical protein